MFTTNRLIITRAKVLFVMRIILCLALGFIAVSSFLHNDYKLDWNIGLIIALLFLSVLWDDIKRLKIFGVLEVDKSKPSTEIADDIKRMPKPPEIFRKVTIGKEKEAPIVPSIQNVLRYHELWGLVKNYQYFWRHWEETDEKCDQVRFSDAFSGRPLRYIDHLYQDIVEYLDDFAEFIGVELRKRVEALRDYAKEIAAHQKEGQYLDSPVFSSKEYVRIMREIHKELIKEETRNA